MGKIDFKTKNLYGLIGLGDAVVYGFIGTFLLFFLTTVAGIPPAIAGTIAALGSVWDVIVSSVVGYVSDRRGRRRPYVLAGAFPLGVATALMFTTVGFSQPMRIVYYTVMLLILWSSFCVFYVPYLAWGAELTQDYNERTVLRGYVYVYNMAGVAIGTILPTVIVDALLQIGRNEQQSWQAVGIFCGLCTALSIFVGAWGIRVRREEGPAAEAAAKAGETSAGADVTAEGEKIRLASLILILKNFWEILHLRSARCIILASIFYLLTNTIISSDRMYFYTYNLHMPAFTISGVMAFQTFISVLFVPVLNRMTRIFDKRTAFLGGMGISLFFSVLYGLLGIGSVLHMVIYSFFISLGSICYWQLIAAMVYDVCEADELVSGKKRSGMVISMQSISESFSEAIALQILGLILSFAGFDGEAAVQTQTALQWTHLSLTLIPAGFMALSMLMIWRYPITRDMYQKILGALERQKQGLPLDENEFSCL